MTITKQARNAGLEITAALVLTISLGSALGGDGGLAPALPLLLVGAYWWGKARQSGLGLEYFTTKIEEQPLARKAPAAVPAVPASEEVSNVVRPLRWGKQEDWWPCRPCVRRFNTEAELLAHQLDAHGDDFFTGLEAA